MRELLIRVITIPAEMETGELILAIAYLIGAVCVAFTIEPQTMMGLAYGTTGVIHVMHKRHGKRCQHSTQDSTDNA